MNKNKIFLGVVMGAALLFAIVVGQNVAENNFSRLGMYVGVAVLAVGALGLKQNAWLLIPICSGLGGTIGGGRLPASIAEMSVAFCFGLFVLFKALKVIPKFPGKLGNHLQSFEQHKQTEAKGDRHFGNRCRQSSSANCPAQPRADGNEKPGILLEPQSSDRQHSHTHIHSQAAEIVLRHILAHHNGKEQSSPHYNPEKDFVLIHSACDSRPGRP